MQPFSNLSFGVLCISVILLGMQPGRIFDIMQSIVWIFYILGFLHETLHFILSR